MFIKNAVIAQDHNIHSEENFNAAMIPSSRTKYKRQIKIVFALPNLSITFFQRIKTRIKLISQLADISVNPPKSNIDGPCSSLNFITAIPLSGNNKIRTPAIKTTTSIQNNLSIAAVKIYFVEYISPYQMQVRIQIAGKIAQGLRR